MEEPLDEESVDNFIYPFSLCSRASCLSSSERRGLFLLNDPGLPLGALFVRSISHQGRCYQKGEEYLIKNATVLCACLFCKVMFYPKVCGYLPYDKSRDWFYQATEVGALIMVLGLITSVAVVFKASYQKDADKFTVPGVPSDLGVLLLVLPALVIALLLHPTLNGNFFTDTAWAFALYLEAVALLPQILMFQSSRNVEVEPFEANFVFGLAVARAMHLVFWMSSFHELNDRDSTSSIQKRFPGHLVVISQVLNLLLVADYIWFYIVAAREKKGVILPTQL